MTIRKVSNLQVDQTLVIQSIFRTKLRPCPADVDKVIPSKRPPPSQHGKIGFVNISNVLVGAGQCRLMATIIGAIGDLDLQANQRTQQKLSCAATAATTGRTIGTSAQRAGTDSLPPTGQGKGKASTTSASNTKQKKGQDLGQEVDKDGMQGKVPSTKVRAERFTTPTPTPKQE
jgi:hypothetical protein